MLDKKVLDKAMAFTKNGGMNIKFWDGEVRHYGPAKADVTIEIHTPKVLRSTLRNASLGLGEAYMDEQLTIDGRLEDFFKFVYQNQQLMDSKLLHSQRIRNNRNVKKNQAKFIEHHYDLGNDFYKLWLDETMLYTCAYFKKNSDSLHTAQTQKIEHVLKKLQLKKGMTLLDIGCGWGNLLITAAKKYGVKGTGVTLSHEQYRMAKQRAKEQGVDKLVRFELKNYLDLESSKLKFDRIVSVGFFEAVGQGNLPDYFRIVSKLLNEDGVSVLHSITTQKETPMDAWIDKYIFPGGYIPSARETINLLPDYNLRLMDYENLRLHYARTLDMWWKNFEAHKKEVIEMFDERFYRMWRFWLAASAASFRYGANDLSQLIFTKGVVNDWPNTREYLYK